MLHEKHRQRLQSPAVAEATEVEWELLLQCHQARQTRAQMSADEVGFRGEEYIYV